MSVGLRPESRFPVVGRCMGERNIPVCYNLTYLHFPLYRASYQAICTRWILQYCFSARSVAIKSLGLSSPVASLSQINLLAILSIHLTLVYLDRARYDPAFVIDPPTTSRTIRGRGRRDWAMASNCVRTWTQVHILFFDAEGFLFRVPIPLSDGHEISC